MRIPCTQGGFSVFDLHHLEACILQSLDDNEADQFLVFRHKDENLVQYFFPLR